MELKEESGLIGLVELLRLDEKTDSCSFVYMLGCDYWNKGYATEAVRALTEYAIKSLRLDEVIAICHPNNLASLRVLEKIGMSPQKTLPQYISLRGNTADCLQYHITRWDFL